MKNSPLNLSLVIPVYNEAHCLTSHIQKLYFFAQKNLNRYHWQIIIVNNGSTDNSLSIARGLAQKIRSITVINLPQKGRGRALRAAWNQAPSGVVSYMDADLSAHLTDFPKLLAALEAGADLAIGSRLAKKAQVKDRTFSREIISRVYNWLLSLTFNTIFKDAQCGFKALKTSVWRDLSAKILDQHWFFDTEMLIMAQKKGYKIKEIPIHWQDDHSSTVKVLKTAKDDLLGILRLIITKPWKN